MAGSGSYVPESVQRSLPMMVRSQLDNMTAEQQSMFLDEYQRKTKSTGLAYLLWFFLAAHYAYMGKWGLTILMWVALVFVVGIFWWIIDAFRIPGMVSNHNRDTATDVLRTMRIIAGS